jgi:hypothetical protein
MQKKKRIRLKVASPCDANWDAMTGDEAVRFCGSCKKNVYQISNMSNDQVEELLAEAGETCGRFYQRKDGTLVTADCSVGLKRKRRKQAVIGMGAGILSVIGVAMSSVGGSPVANQSEESTPIDTPDHELIMGAMEYEPHEELDDEDVVEDEEIVEPVERHRVIMGRMRRIPEPDFDLDLD